MKRAIALLLSLLLILTLAGCGRSAAYEPAAAPAEESAVWSTEAEYDMMADEKGYWDEASEMPAAAEGGTTAAASAEEIKSSKIVYTANFEMETLTFDQSVADLEALVESVGGYFENRGLYNYNAGYRYGNYTVRVPAEQYKAFCTAAGSQFNVTYFNESAENISENYYDVESRLETANIKLERLQTLLKQASSMEDIITIENAISDVEYTIEALSGELRHYDALVDYATVTVNLQEVYRLSGTEIAPLNFGQRLGNSFVNGLRSVGGFIENLVLGIAYSWIYLAMIAAMIVLLVRLGRKKGVTVRRRQKGKKNVEKTAEKPEE